MKRPLPLKQKKIENERPMIAESSNPQSFIFNLPRKKAFWQ